jgi:hypothetical protein
LDAAGGHVWTAPGWQELSSRFAALVGAAMCSAFRCGSHDRWPCPLRIRSQSNCRIRQCFDPSGLSRSPDRPALHSVLFALRTFTSHRFRTGGRVVLLIRTANRRFTRFSASKITPRLNKTAAPYSAFGTFCFILRGGVIALGISRLVEYQPVLYHPIGKIDTPTVQTATARLYWSRSTSTH